jgi:hypothetical protein
MVSAKPLSRFREAKGIGGKRGMDTVNCFIFSRI